jgi:F-type H+-transporting ATPase subunit epsilon
MELEIITPLGVEKFDGVLAVRAEGAEGNFTILPRHADYASYVEPSVFTLERPGGEEYFGIDEGVLVKCGKKVSLSVRQAVGGDSLSDLKARVLAEFKNIDDGEKRARRALAQLGGNIARLILDLKEARA